MSLEVELPVFMCGEYEERPKLKCAFGEKSGWVVPRSDVKIQRGSSSYMPGAFFPRPTILAEKCLTRVQCRLDSKRINVAKELSTFRFPIHER